MKMGEAPSIYSIVVPIYSSVTYDLAGAVVLKYGDLDSCLALLAVPASPDKSGAPAFVDLQEMQEVFEYVKPFVSIQTLGVTGSLPLVDLPNYMAIDQNGDTVFATAFCQVLEVDPETGELGISDITFSIPSNQTEENIDLNSVFWVNPLKNTLRQLPDDFQLGQNYPNPFNPAAEISFSLDKPSHVILEVYNLLGQKVETLVNESRDAGNYSVIWDAKKHASGVYFYRLNCDGISQSRKMLLIK